MNIKDFTISINSSIKDSIIKIDNNKGGFILLTNPKNQVVGIATDGDIRRTLIKNNDLDQKIKSCSNSNFIYVSEDFSHETIYKKLDNNIKFIPVLNKKNELVSIITKDNIPYRAEIANYARAKSPVRISFGGGGSDTTSFFKTNTGAVINSTISIYSHATLYQREDSKITIDSLDIGDYVEYSNLGELSSSNNQFNLINVLITTINPDFGFDLIIQSDFPKSSGLGGSSVVLASIIGCFNEFRKDKWTSYEIAEIAFESERLHLGISGGWQDQYATVFGGFNFIEFKSDENLVFPMRLKNEIKYELEESLVLCYTKTTHDSNLIHENQKLTSLKKEINQNIKKNVDLTYEMKKFLLKGNLNELGKCLDKAWEFKKSFSTKITNKHLDKIYNGAKKNGALGGKLMGAGGGGYFLFFVMPKNRNKLISWIKRMDLGYTPFSFENKGLQSWSNRKI
jgi:D-glycero-alpha-D-manno-heptose-7-phosphate kinase